MKLQKLLSLTRRAISDYDMISENDKICIGISGGKDSLALLMAMTNLRRFYPVKFDLVAITVDLGFDIQDFGKIKALCDELDIEYHVIKTEIADIVFKVREEASPCSLCAKMRKGALNDKAKELGCNKIAYAHHMDDIIETFLLSLFYESRIHTFSPVTYLDRMELTLIRPFLYVSEGEIKGFAKESNLPVAKNPCPVDGYTKRQYVKDLLSNLKKDNNNIKKHIFRAILSGEISGFHL